MHNCSKDAFYTSWKSEARQTNSGLTFCESCLAHKMRVRSHTVYLSWEGGGVAAG